MGIIHDENYDAFLSYAHDDNVLHDGAVSIFKQYFEPKFRAEYRLKIQTEQEVEVFMDKYGMPANGDLTNELQEAIKRSTFLIIFIGKSYPNSEWCGTELKLFAERFIEKRIKALEQTFVIVLDKAAEKNDWGAYLEKPGRPIFEKFYDEDTGRMIPLILEGYDGQAVPSPRFLGRLRHIVETMTERANALKGKV